jgi:hypothetical protein
MSVFAPTLPAVAGSTPVGVGNLPPAAEQQGVPLESVAEVVAAQIQQARSTSGQPLLDQGALERLVDRALHRGRPRNTSGSGEAAPPTAGGVGAYASNARVTSGGVPAGRVISFLA